VLALRAVTDRFIYLEEGDLVDLRPDSIDIWNIDEASVIRASVRVELEADDMERGNYRHFMQKEMFQQPEVVKRVLEGRVGKDRVLDGALGEGSQDLLRQVESVTIVACGTSYLAGGFALPGGNCQRISLPQPRYAKKQFVHHHLPKRGNRRYLGSLEVGKRE
jgi:glucosamine--fructose-6-phosphate aminotransferase (isomerizing)